MFDIATHPRGRAWRSRDRRRLHGHLTRERSSSNGRYGSEAAHYAILPMQSMTGYQQVLDGDGADEFPVSGGGALAGFSRGATIAS
jgi:hypothetical protein